MMRGMPCLLFMHPAQARRSLAGWGFGAIPLGISSCELPELLWNAHNVVTQR